MTLSWVLKSSEFNISSALVKCSARCKAFGTHETEFHSLVHSCPAGVSLQGTGASPITNFLTSSDFRIVCRGACPEGPAASASTVVAASPVSPTFAASELKESVSSDKTTV